MIQSLIKYFYNCFMNNKFLFINLILDTDECHLFNNYLIS
uniref:Uncharacterized protein n=1 Tax=Osmundaria fimbriata TaxID=228265 RepID=A0A1Z1M3X7_OSMFI|nr:hypothetical protein [Osmundaria fimbriata]ARW60797.1 hypothetical protein [Osmundaria fimbriata]